MSKQSFLDCEYNSLQKFKKFQLPSGFKNAGIVISILAFITLILNRHFFSIPELKTIARYSLVIGLLIISISKEKIEDELISQLRMQSYTFSFIMGVIYALAIPFIAYLVDNFIRNKEAGMKDTGDLSILVLLLTTQILYFELLKRLHK